MSQPRKFKKEVAKWDDPKKRFLSHNLRRAKNRKDGKVFEIDVEYLFRLGQQQGWKCVFTGEPLEFDRGGYHSGKRWWNPRSCSIDRIDSTKDYIPGNVQLVWCVVNQMKADMDEELFHEFIQKIYNQKKGP